jgi:hypothetical protein
VQPISTDEAAIQRALAILRVIAHTERTKNESVKGGNIIDIIDSTEGFDKIGDRWKLDTTTATAYLQAKTILDFLKTTIRDTKLKTPYYDMVVKLLETHLDSLVYSRSFSSGRFDKVTAQVFMDLLKKGVPQEYVEASSSQNERGENK